MKRTALLIALALVVGALFAPGVEAAKKKKKKKTGPVVVGTDPDSDWGANADPTLQPVGDALGMELVEAVIDMADAETVNFIIKVNSLPSNGGAPEVARYTWNFSVDGETVELDGKWTNYSRGVCDPTSGQCPPPRDPGQQPFFLRGNCSATQNVTLCEELAVVQAIFDPAEATITIPVTLEQLEAKKGSLIGPGTNLFGGSISAAPSAFFTNNSMPMDTMLVLEAFKVF